MILNLGQRMNGLGSCTIVLNGLTLLVLILHLVGLVNHLLYNDSLAA